MRKTAVVLFCLLFLTSCGRERTEVPVFYYTYSDTFVSGVRASIGKALGERGIRYQSFDAGSSQTTQTEQILTAAAMGVRALIVNIVNTGSDDAAEAIVDVARARDIPVIFFNREVGDDVINGYDRCVFVGTRSEEAGILQGEMIGNYLCDHYEETDLNGDGRISYILFKGEEGNNEAIYRTKYSVERANEILASAGYPPLLFYDETNPNRYLVDKNGQWSATAANEYMTTVLTSHTEARGNMVELVICNNDGMAEGAISALNVAGYNLGKAGKTIPVFGVDAIDAAKDLIARGMMAGTVLQDTDAMAEAITAMIGNALAGKPMTDGMTEYEIDGGSAKIRIPYAPYFGEGETENETSA